MHVNRMPCVCGQVLRSKKVEPTGKTTSIVSCRVYTTHCYLESTRSDIGQYVVDLLAFMCAWYFCLAFHLGFNPFL